MHKAHFWVERWHTKEAEINWN